MSSNLRRDKPLPQSKLDSRINPNYASQTSLMRLPGIGATGAAAIVAYREQFAQRNTGDVPFDNCADLDNVKGIGPKTAASLCESLKFD
jgi:competence ComEA-like helix-hairpin-helix protein